MLAALVFFAMFVVGGFTVGLVMMFAIWEIIYSMGKVWGYDKDSNNDYMKFLIAGIPFAVLACGSVFPFSAYSISYIGMIEAYTGITVSGAQYTILQLPIMLLVLFAYVIVARFVFKIDTTRIKETNIEFDIPKLTTYQKVVLGALIFIIVACFWISVMPATWGITIFLNKLGVFGIIFLVDAILAMLAFKDGIPFGQAMAKGLSFDLYFGLGAVMAMSTAIAADECGIAVWLENIMTPLATSMGAIPFLVFILLIAAIATQFASNTVVIVLFATLVFSMSDKLGLNSLAFFMMLTNVGNTAVVTPAANPVAAIGYANEWLTPKDALKYGLVECIVTFVVVLVFGYAYGCIIF